MKFHGNEQKKGTLKIQKSQIAVLVLNQSPISAVFATVQFPFAPKSVLSGDPLIRKSLHFWKEWKKIIRHYIFLYSHPERYIPISLKALGPLAAYTGLNSIQKEHFNFMSYIFERYFTTARWIAKVFYYVNYGSSIITSNVCQIISVMKTKYWYFKNSSFLHFN